MKKTVSVVSFFLLAACAPDYLKTGLPALEGKPVSEAVRYLGRPTEEKQVLGKTVQSWVVHQAGSFGTPGAGPYPEISGGASGTPTIRFSRGDLPQREQAYVWNCRLDIVSEQGVIVDAQYHGDGGGCRVFGDKLKPLAEQADGKKKTR